VSSADADPVLAAQDARAPAFAETREPSLKGQ
jgi:hypothetical protein